ncbi:DUF3237 domain-containing protein [Arthrobacter sp.]|uniref:DUF3237 domain-containing protein n=1 Tax=Arthrobacter sp. TaxID=1667 RepID=UPI00289D2704|nr:DUF3237 domain-containing protein [Arthrobacter sp.]
MTQITPHPAESGHPSVPALLHRFRIVAEVAPDILIDAAGGGELDFIPITGGPGSGDIRGEIIPGGGDWCLLKSPGSYRVEARYGIRTESGSYIDVYNVGILTRPHEGADTPGRTQEYFVTTPVFRTTDPTLAWLTQSVFIGHAAAGSGATTIDVFEVLAPALSV